MSSLDQFHTTSSYGVYTGVWTNWSHGRIFGVTLTLKRREGALLIAFLALFVSVVGTHFWRIACFALHRAYSTEVAQDALYHQRQIVLRNSANGTSGLVSLANILWTWSQKKLARKVYQRTLPLIGFALFCMVAFGFASTFSSRISTALGNDVLIHGSNCGILQAGDNNTYEDQLKSYYPYVTQYANSWSNYAEECYSNNSETQKCNAYIKQQLPTSINRNASCPFEEDICKLKYGNIVFDTGYLDSNSDLGVNTPANERVLFRRVSSCAPLKTEGHRQSYQPSGTRNNYTAYFYGESTDNNGSFTPNSYTYYYPDYEIVDGHYRIPDSAPTDYVLLVGAAHVFNGSVYGRKSQINLIPALRQSNADVHLAFLSANQIFYVEPVYDPWYSARRESGLTTTAGPTSAFLATEAVSVLACSVKEQYCNPNLPVGSQCSHFGGTLESTLLSDSLWKSKKHKSIFRWISNIFNSYSFTIMDVASMLGPTSLLARYRTQTGLSGSLPDNQWQLELEHWHAASLVGAQATMAITANGPPESHLSQWLRKPKNAVEKNLCQNQKVKSLDHTNFSVFWLCFTLIFGSIIICLAYTLEPLISWILKWCKRTPDTYKRLEWTTNDTLQLHRLAHEELEIGTWSNCAKDIPITEKGQRLAVLDLDDKEHPRLKAPPPIFDLVMASENNEGDGTSSKENTSCPSNSEQNSDCSRTNSSVDYRKNSVPNSEQNDGDNSIKANTTGPSTSDENSNSSRTESSVGYQRNSEHSTLTTFDEDA